MAIRTVTLLLLAALVGRAAAHGVLSEPPSRALRLASGVAGSAAFNLSGSCVGHACEWYTQRAHVPDNQKTTICDKGLRTMNVSCTSQNPPDWPCLHHNPVPWCAPGTAAIKSPCGIFSGGWEHNGRDMLDLDDTPTTVWVAGDVANISHYLIANHGGGYSYRLCRNVPGQLTEECFQGNHLEFASEMQSLVDQSGQEVAAFPAVRTNVGTFPAGSTWTRNPFPMELGYIDPIPGHPEIYGRGPFTYALRDTVKVPATLEPGNYVLSFRWDAEQVQQVWAQCSDITIVKHGQPAAEVREREAVRLARQKTEAPQRYAVCTGASIGLDVFECDAWAKIFDTMGGANWGIDPRIRTDPCTSIKSDWKFSIVCQQFRDNQHITEVYMLGEVVTGNFSAEFARFSQLKALSVVSSSVTGPLPENMGDLSELTMIWLDDNKHMTGPLPSSLAKIGSQLAVLELHYSGFSGSVLPALPYNSIADCTLNGLVFACPLPADADKCGAVCV